MRSRPPAPVGLPAVGIDVERPPVPSTTSFSRSATLDAFEARQVEHGVEPGFLSMIERSPRRAGSCGRALRANGAQRSSASVRSIVSISNSRGTASPARSWAGWRMSLREGSFEVLERGHDRQSADEFRDQAIFQQVLRFDPRGKISARPFGLRRQDLGAEADRARPPAGGNDLLGPLKAPAAHERMLVVSTCRNSAADACVRPCGGTDAMVPSIDLEQGLLHDPRPRRRG